MKKEVVFLLLLLLCSGNIMAQKSERQAQRQKEKIAQQHEDSLRYAVAVESLLSGNFVVEANRILFRRGETTNVNPNTNFILREGDQAFVQVAFNTVRPGPNGIGGITVKGSVSDVTMKIGTKGQVTYSMQVQGLGISARVDLTLVDGSNRVSALITPNFNSNRVTLEGNLIPTSQSEVYKGRGHF
ncbi:MAG: DUF4251 domain-containing protein [Alistipes sp.]|nr:DUF4251 domain-containing protein [Alistipes sp.]